MNLGVNIVIFRRRFLIAGLVAIWIYNILQSRSICSLQEMWMAVELFYMFGSRDGLHTKTHQLFQMQALGRCKSVTVPFPELGYVGVSTWAAPACSTMTRSILLQYICIIFFGFFRLTFQARFPSSYLL